jgi:hypothetical protein
MFATGQVLPFWHRLQGQKTAKVRTKVRKEALSTPPQFNARDFITKPTSYNQGVPSNVHLRLSHRLRVRWVGQWGEDLPLMRRWPLDNV